MSESILHGVTTEFDERNAFLNVSLGALSFQRQFMRIVEPSASAAREASTPTVAVDGSRTPTRRHFRQPGDAEVLAFILGLIGAGETLARHLSAALREPAAGSRGRPDRDAEPSGDGGDDARAPASRSGRGVARGLRDHGERDPANGRAGAVSRSHLRDLLE